MPKRDQAGKPIEFAHIIQNGQVSNKFITDYAVFEHKPDAHKLLEPAVEQHRELSADQYSVIAKPTGFPSRDRKGAANRKPRLGGENRSLTVAARIRSVHQITCDEALERYRKSCSGTLFSSPLNQGGKEGGRLLHKN
ncbi:MAG: hypothetical protein KJ749_13505, partial [Planctomycetes bacterium]|nr:hypothetical protein [Planctomycetota bacterium]